METGAKQPGGSQEALLFRNMPWEITPCLLQERVGVEGPDVVEGVERAGIG